MTVPARLSVVTLGVADLARSIAFYTALGWERMPGGDPTIIEWFATNGSVIGLFPHDDLAADVGVAAEPPTGFRGITLAMHFATETEADVAYEEALAAGATAVKPPLATEWGGYSGYIADPDGHYWELVAGTGFVLDADARVIAIEG